MLRSLLKQHSERKQLSSIPEKGFLVIVIESFKFKNLLGGTNLIFEMTIQVRVQDIYEGRRWYQSLLNRNPDFEPHDGFAKWEVIPGC